MSTGARSDLNQTYFQALVPGNSWTLDFTNTSAQVGPFASTTTLVSIFPTQDCWVKIGSGAQTAAAISSGASGTSVFCPGGIQNFLGVDPSDYLAIVRNATSGTIYICECT